MSTAKPPAGAPASDEPPLDSVTANGGSKFTDGRASPPTSAASGAATTSDRCRHAASASCSSCIRRRNNSTEVCGAAIAAKGSPQRPDTQEEEASLAVSRDWYSTIATFIAGGVAGAASRTLTAPLDRVKIIVQEGYLVNVPQGAKVSPRKNAGILDVARMIKYDGGIKGFWRGNLINCLKAGPEFALVFSLRRYFTSLYEDCVEREKRRIRNATRRHAEHEEIARKIREREREERESMTGSHEDPAEEDVPSDLVADHQHVGSAAARQHTEMARVRVSVERKQQIDIEASIFTPPFNRLGCLSHVPRLAVNCSIGACAGLGAQAVVYPLEVIKTRVVVSKSSEFKGGVREVIRRAYEAGGVREFYRGFAPNMAGIVVYRGLEMGIYSSIQQTVMLYRMQWQHMNRHDATLGTGEVGMAGMIASIISQTVSYPFNVVRTRLQTQGSNGREKAYTGMLDCMVKIVRHKGVTALFSGLMANYLKAVPATMCAFMVFEKTQQLLIGDD